MNREALHEPRSSGCESAHSFRLETGADLRRLLRVSGVHGSNARPKLADETLREPPPHPGPLPLEWEEGGRRAGEGNNERFVAGEQVRKERAAIGMPGLVCIASLILTVILLAGCVSPASTSLQRFQFQEPQMGTLFTITLYAPNETVAKAAAQAAFQRVAALNRVMTDYDPQSELMQLRQHPVGEAVRVSEDLFDVLQRSQRVAIMSDGAFDVTVGPMVQLWRRARRQRALPAPERVAEAAKAVGYQKLKLDAHRRTVALLVPNMRLDLGGIAKGYAADQALAVLRDYGLRRAMVAASGDIAIGDPPPGQKAWRIGVGSIDAAGKEPTRILLLHNAGVSTSGDTEQFVEINGVRYSHVVDPKTGYGLAHRIGVTIVARDATTTDSLGTTVSVLGAERGLKLVESLSDVSALIVTLDGEQKQVVESKRFGKISQAESKAR